MYTSISMQSEKPDGDRHHAHHETFRKLFSASDSLKRHRILP